MTTLFPDGMLKTQPDPVCVIDAGPARMRFLSNTSFYVRFTVVPLPEKVMMVPAAAFFTQ